MVMVEDHVVYMVGKTDDLRSIKQNSRGVRQSVSKCRDEGFGSGHSLLPNLSESNLCNGVAPVQYSILSQTFCKVLIDTLRRGFPRPFRVL